MDRLRDMARCASWACVTASLAVVPCGRAAGAQLRPVEPLDWSLVGGTHDVSAGVGVGLLKDQQASLAGTRGDLHEYGNFRVGVRSGRITLEVAGTLVRRFEDQAVLRPPAAGSDPPDRTIRRDAGDVVASSVIRISGAGPAQVALRFGTRLPTPSNEVGLDRDRTDFFSTLAGRYSAGPLTMSAESGVAILGTRVDGLDQLDVLVFSAAAELVAGPVTAQTAVIGQNDMHSGFVRGNEDLSEVRFGLTAGDRIWGSAMTVIGLSDFSPRRGILLMVGVQR